MNILVDTSVWSIGLRRKRRDLNPQETKFFYEWHRLVSNGHASIIGPIRQEILSGIRVPAQFDAIRGQLAFFPDIQLYSDDFVLAAHYFNVCRNAGISPSDGDMTICAAAHTHGIPIFSADPDFLHYARHLPIKLHAPELLKQPA